MSFQVTKSSDGRKFHTSVTAVLSAVLLGASILLIVNGLQEVLQPGLVWLVNLSIDQGHFPFSRLPHGGAIWSLVLLEFLTGAGVLCLSYGLASWNYRKRSKP